MPLKSHYTATQVAMDTEEFSVRSGSNMESKQVYENDMEYRKCINSPPPKMLSDEKWFKALTGHEKSGVTFKISQEYQRNYFIMDSEQLVCNPFHDLQAEAIDVTKKVSTTEKLTSVKNNVEDTKFNLKHGKLKQEITGKMKKLHDNTSKLRYEVKLMDINKRKIDLEVKKRIEPARDFSYDSSQINNSEKRLGIMAESYYLQKQQKFPLRGRNVNDMNATPMISKAREVLREQRAKKRFEDERRSQWGNSSASIHSASSNSTRGYVIQRRDSKSAPASFKPMSATTQGKSLYGLEDDMTSKLPSIVSKTGKRQDSHVKFSLRDDKDMRTSTPDRMTRSHTFTASTKRKSIAWDSDDEEWEEGDFVETINLRALLFGDKCSEITASSRPQTQESMRSMPSIRRSKNKPLTQEMLVEEQKRIDKKINQFYNMIDEKEEDSEEEEVCVVEEVAKPPPQTKQFETKASAILSAFSKPVDKTKVWKTPEDLKREEAAKELMDRKREAQNKSQLSNRSRSAQSTHSLKQKKEKKNMWQFIRTNMEEGEIKRCKTPTELILQQMTKLNLRDKEKTHIPLNSASRAMRHTPTFKMRKIVEKLMKSRTKFEQQEVDNLRKQMDGQNGGSVEQTGQPVGAVG